ncbi:hypothetical protein DdX_17403 [Ditylenchus destructor]|uniref:Uncharacterized protein n=1 Tax=Ditylenchus destructor TaxID=166010 RepID=A0AAD4MLG3_9BILA|nr:hypothetical protein DdX_17403 [Ditylenchus destructor]
MALHLTAAALICLFYLNVTTAPPTATIYGGMVDDMNVFELSPADKKLVVEEHKNGYKLSVKDMMGGGQAFNDGIVQVKEDNFLAKIGPKAYVFFSPMNKVWQNGVERDPTDKELEAVSKHLKRH